MISIWFLRVVMFALVFFRCVFFSAKQYIWYKRLGSTSPQRCLLEGTSAQSFNPRLLLLRFRRPNGIDLALASRPDRGGLSCEIIHVRIIYRARGFIRDRTIRGGGLSCGILWLEHVGFWRRPIYVGLKLKNNTNILVEKQLKKSCLKISPNYAFKKQSASGSQTQLYFLTT